MFCGPYRHRHCFNDNKIINLLIFGLTPVILNDILSVLLKGVKMGFANYWNRHGSLEKCGPHPQSCRNCIVGNKDASELELHERYLWLQRYRVQLNLWQQSFHFRYVLSELRSLHSWCALARQVYLAADAVISSFLSTQDMGLAHAFKTTWMLQFRS